MNITIQDLKQIVHKLEKLSLENELAYVSLTGKNEDYVRNKLSFLLQDYYKDVIV